MLGTLVTSSNVRSPIINSRYNLHMIGLSSLFYQPYWVYIPFYGGAKCWLTPNVSTRIAQLGGFPPGTFALPWLEPLTTLKKETGSRAAAGMMVKILVTIHDLVGFPKMVCPLAGWFMLENPDLKWRMTGGTPMTQPYRYQFLRVF